MKHLLKIVTNEIDYEANKKYARKKPSPTRQKYFAYKINGYWFYMTRRMWAEYTGIGYNTICGRDNGGRTVGQILGYEPFTRYSRRTKMKTGTVK